MLASYEAAQTRAQCWIRILQPRVQRFHPALRLGIWRNVLGAFPLSNSMLDSQWEIDVYPVRVLRRAVFSLYGCQTPAQHWIKILHPWVQEFYPVLGLGVWRKAPEAFPDSNTTLDTFQPASQHYIRTTPVPQSFQTRNFCFMSSERASWFLFGFFGPCPYIFSQDFLQKVFPTALPLQTKAMPQKPERAHIRQNPPFLFSLEFLGDGRNPVSRVQFQKRELTEFCGELGEFCENSVRSLWHSN